MDQVGAGGGLWSVMTIMGPILLALAIAFAISRKRRPPADNCAANRQCGISMMPIVARKARRRRASSSRPTGTDGRAGRSHTWLKPPSIRNSEQVTKLAASEQR